MEQEHHLFKSLVEASPYPVYFIYGPELTIRAANQATLRAWQKDDSIIGMSFTEALPELKGQPFEVLLRQVMQTGKAYHAVNDAATLLVDGKPETFYFDFSFQPLLNAEGLCEGVMCYATDVTAIERARQGEQEALRQTEMAKLQLELAISGANLGTWSSDLETGIMHFNPALANIFGCPDRDSLPFTEITSRIDPEYLPMIVDTIGSAIANSSSYDITFRQCAFDTGEMIWLRSVGRAVAQPGGQRSVISGVTMDVTGEVNTNRQIEDLNESLLAANRDLVAQYAQISFTASRLRYLLSDAPIAIAVFNGPDMIIEAANKKMLETWGKSDEILGKPLRIAVPELEGQEFLPLLDNVYRTGQPYYGLEARAVLEQKGILEDVYSNFVYHPLIDEKNVTNGIMVTANVVTEQVNARRKVEDAETNLRLAIEAANLGAWFIQPGSMELQYNASLARIFGYTADVPMTYEQAIAQVSEEFRPILLERIDQAIKGGGDYEVTYSQRRFDNGKLIWLHAFGRITTLATSGEPSFSGFVMDITEQKKDEQRKNDFIAMVSHELKTPLTSLSGYLQILLIRTDESTDPFTLSALETAGKQVRRMTRMINGFLNLSRLESGKIFLERSNFNLQDLMIHTLNEARQLHPGYQFNYSAPEGAIVLDADYDKVSNVLSNFINNAVKYSPGTIEIGIACTVDDNIVKVEVTDHGIGISQENIENLFQRYFRVESNKAISGFGIGLYLSKEIIQRHQGTIGVQSEPGQGSTFFFTLPVNVA